jgi:hypothetical protein
VPRSGCGAEFVLVEGLVVALVLALDAPDLVGLEVFADPRLRQISLLTRGTILLLSCTNSSARLKCPCNWAVRSSQVTGGYTLTWLAFALRDPLQEATGDQLISVVTPEQDDDGAWLPPSVRT